MTPNNATTVAAEDSIVILGGGVTGLATAYYLAQHKQQLALTVVEPSSRICAGASSQNEGVIGSFGMKHPIVDLATLSVALHAEIASTASQTFGYSGLNSYALFSHGYDPKNPKLPYPSQGQIPLDRLPSWLKVPSTWQAGLVTSQKESHRVDALPFCEYLKDECQRLGVKFLFSSTVESADMPGSVTLRDRRTEQSQRIPCSALVIAAGSWSARVMATLFPEARVKIPMSDAQPIQSWIRLRTSSSTPPPAASSTAKIPTCAQAWLGPALDDQDIHISRYADGDFFVAGPIEDAPYPLPLPEKIDISREEAEQMRVEAEKFLRLGENTSVSIVRSGRACMPRLTREDPIIANVHPSLLFAEPGNYETPQSSHVKPGVYINVGQSLDGVTLAPASGKLMSELVLGLTPSINPAPFAFPSDA